MSFSMNNNNTGNNEIIVKNKLVNHVRSPKDIIIGKMKTQNFKKEEEHIQRNIMTITKKQF
jgi:hypothetical protein